MEFNSGFKGLNALLFNSRGLQYFTAESALERVTLSATKAPDKISTSNCALSGQ